MLHPIGGALGGALAAVFVLSIVFAAAAWVYADATTHARRGNSIVFSAGALHLRTPAGWFFACLLVSELFIPLYLDRRGMA